MDSRYLESDATLRQTERIAVALGVSNIPYEMVRNEWDEPLAVVIRGGLDISRILGSVGIRRLDMRFGAEDETEAESKERLAVADTMPLAGQAGLLVLPASFLKIVDIAVQAATERSDILATRLDMVSVDGVSLVDRDSGVHIDSQNLSDEKLAESLCGLNIHTTRVGIGEASFGLVRSFDAARRLEKVMAQDWYGSKRFELAWQIAEPFSAPIEIAAGDVVIFQAARALGRLPVAHEFKTLVSHDLRLSEIYTPSIAPAADVLAERRRIANAYHLQELGYAA